MSAAVAQRGRGQWFALAPAEFREALRDWVLWGRRPDDDLLDGILGNDLGQVAARDQILRPRPTHDVFSLDVPPGEIEVAPQRDEPRAAALAVAAIGLLYLVDQAAYVGTDNAVVTGAERPRSAGFQIERAQNLRDASLRDFRYFTSSVARLNGGVYLNCGSAVVLPEAADDFLAQCRDIHGLQIEGLMCIPPADEAAPRRRWMRWLRRRRSH